ncbi:MAG: efflux RND transporter periplasmic adaptor subunit [Bacteroidales bacterium]
MVRKIRIISNGVVLLSLASFFTVACTKKEKAPAAMPPMNITVAKPVIQEIVLSKQYPGYLQAEQTVNLTARVSGALQKILYTPGQFVQQGATLFIIEPTVYKNQLEEAKASLETARAQLAYAKANYERMTQASLKNAVSQISVIQSKSQMDQAQASVYNAEAAVSSAQTNLNYCYVKAPCSGRITQNTVDVGNYVNAAQAPTLATIYQDKQMYAYFDVTDNQYLANLLNANRSNKSNEQLLDSIQIYPGQTGSSYVLGKLDYLDPTIDLTTGTINLRAILNNPNGDLRNGLYARVKLPYQRVPEAVLISNSSISTDQLGRYVYLVNDSNKVVYQPVTVGQIVNDSMVQIVNGVKAGDQYVTSAMMKVQPGMTVKPILKK